MASPATFAALAVAACATGSAVAVPPRLIFTVMADDIGWADVSFTAGVLGENRTAAQAARIGANADAPPPLTPVMASLAAEGIVLGRQYAYLMCTPSRCSFLSGRVPAHVQLQLTNPEQPNGGIPYNMTTLPAVMARAGYTTAVIGKWDAGMATHRHTPQGRGFNISTVYFSHKVDYYNKTSMQTSCSSPVPIDMYSNGGPAYGVNQTEYIEYLFRDQLLSLINSWDGVSPLWIHYTPHIAHCPLQVPRDVLAQWNWTTDDESACSAQTPYIFPGSTLADYACRRQYSAMVGLLDGVLGDVTAAIRAKGAWDDTLMVFTSDNGGPSDIQENAANNFPERGMKYALFEGGVRVAAFASGGALPPAVRGTVSNAFMHVADWYTTLAGLANVSTFDPIAAAAGLPQPDGVDLWPVLSGANATSARSSYLIDSRGLIAGDYKLIVAKTADFASWAGPTFPNASTPQHQIDGVLDCSNGCLFDVVADPTEHKEISAQHPDIVAAMKAQLAAESATIYSNNDTFAVQDTICPANVTGFCACWAVANVYSGFFGPFVNLY